MKICLQNLTNSIKIPDGACLGNDLSLWNWGGTWTELMSLMCWVTMFGVSQVPNTLHWMGSQQPRVLDGGRSVVNLLSLVFFAAYCQWHNIILTEWLHSTDIRAPSYFLISDDMMADQSKPISTDVSSLQSGLVTALGNAGMHGGSIIRGGGGLLWSAQLWQYISHHNGPAHICIYYLIIPSQYDCARH